ncbi:MAG: hypothetical protein K2O12_05425, partial [Muribaculaceae bacterium]|nr:hypothetical protein [Muribaculaceae bacterium]
MSGQILKISDRGHIVDFFANFTKNPQMCNIKGMLCNIKYNKTSEATAHQAIASENKIYINLLMYLKKLIGICAVGMKLCKFGNHTGAISRIC